MPIQIDTVINEILPAANSGNGEGETDNRWQKHQEMEASHDEHKVLAMRVRADDFDD